ncbi:MAG TPA: hypothetical protein VFE59_11660 [Trebonia sp.]|nr:hypothetical protein [Trebonia sp.]
MGLEGAAGRWAEAVEGEVEDAGWLVGGDRLVADEQAVVQVCGTVMIGVALAVNACGVRSAFARR